MNFAGNKNIIDQKSVNFKMSRVIFVDFSIFLYAGVFSSVKISQYAPYLSLKSILACLKCIEIDPNDIIILAVDSGKGSWRKEIDTNYKANRKDIRDKTGLNWDKHFEDYTTLLSQLDRSSPFHIIKLDRIEADDIIGYGVRYYKNHECIIISTDTDFKQLLQFPNVKVFSSKTKAYRIVKYPERVVDQKIRMEKMDNLTTPVITQQDYDKRKMLVNLCKLPDEIEATLEAKFLGIGPKSYQAFGFPFQKALGSPAQIFDNENKQIVTYANSFKSKKPKKTEQLKLEV